LNARSISATKSEFIRSNSSPVHVPITASEGWHVPLRNALTWPPLYSDDRPRRLPLAPLLDMDTGTYEWASTDA
jgi:hypothetical protein